MDSATRAAQTDRVRRIYDRVATASREPRGDGWLLKGATEWLRARASGETLEVGIGRGRMLPAYGPGVRLSGIELSEGMLGAARRRAAELGLQARLLQGDAQALPFPDANFDTVVFSLVLCTVPDDRLAVAEAARVLRPGGRLLLIEHVRSPHLWIRAIEHVFDRLEGERYGEHYLREPLLHVLAEGLNVEELERRRLSILEWLAARKPNADAIAEAV